MSVGEDTSIHPSVTAKYAEKCENAFVLRNFRESLKLAKEGLECIESPKSSFKSSFKGGGTVPSTFTILLVDNSYDPGGSSQYDKHFLRMAVVALQCCFELSNLGSEIGPTTVEGVERLELESAFRRRGFIPLSVGIVWLKLQLKLGQNASVVESVNRTFNHAGFPVSFGRMNSPTLRVIPIVYTKGFLALLEILLVTTIRMHSIDVALRLLSLTVQRYQLDKSDIASLRTRLQLADADLVPASYVDEDSLRNVWNHASPEKNLTNLKTMPDMNQSQTENSNDRDIIVHNNSFYKVLYRRFSLKAMYSIIKRSFASFGTQSVSETDSITSKLIFKFRLVIFLSLLFVMARRRRVLASAIRRLATTMKGECRSLFL